MRGQTTLDFAVGISVFLAVVVFVFIFVPGLLQPFTTGTEAETVLSNRVADQVAEETLSDPREPYLLDRECTLDFFEGNAPGSCRYESGSTVEERLGVTDPAHHLNVTVERNLSSSPGSQLCWDESELTIVERTSSDCNPGGADVVLTAGDSPPPANDRVVTARRVVSIEGEDVTLFVRAW